YKESGDLFLGKSLDGGTTWSTPVRVNDAAGEVYAYGDYEIAVSPVTGSVFLTWVDRRVGSLHVFMARSIDGGNTFEPNLQADSVSRNASKPSLAVGANGMIYVGYRGYHTGSVHPSPYEVWLTRVAEVAATQPLAVENAVRVSDTPEQDNRVKVVAGAGNELFLCWVTFDGDLFASHSADAGRTFAAESQVNDITGSADHGFDVARYQGTVYVLWGDSRTDREGDVFVDSADASLSFGTDTQVNDVTRRYQEYPSLAIRGAGELHAFWQDLRDNAASYDVFTSTSADGGRTWSTSERVNTDRPEDQRKVQVVFDAQGTAYCAWQDERHNPGTTQFDLYLAKGR
ncbi:glycoside hydrolase, partial [Planctomycetota bacterium]|nr:glycoside hydrolase [Planctomycetota bacterium]